MLYFIIKSIINYFNYPTQINVDIIREWPQYFPAFSICNACPFHLDQFLPAFLNFTYKFNLTNDTNASTLDPSLSPYILDFLVYEMNKNEALLSSLYPLASMLYQCTYNSVPCSVSDFVPFFSASYGFCYTFNGKMKNVSNDSVRYAYEYGGDGILDLQLYVHSHQYVPYFCRSKNIIHNIIIIIIII